MLVVTEAVPLERVLDVACAVANALLDRAAGAGSPETAEGGRRRREGRVLVEEWTRPTAVFDPTSHTPWLVNAVWRELFGASVLPAALLDGVAAAARAGSTIHLAELAIEPDARLAYCAATLRAMRDDLGATTGVVVVCAVVTDEIIARELAVDMYALVWSLGAAGGPAYRNRRWCTYTGTSMPAPWQEAVHPDDLTSCVDRIALAARTGSAADLEVRLRRGDGEFRLHRVRIATSRARWFGAAIDIHDAHTALAERTESLARERAARADAEQANRLKDQFLAAVSHELRAPLTTMLLWEKVLRDDAGDAALHRQALDAIRDSALSQSHLVRDLLDISRAISGKLYLDLRPVQIEDVVAAALEAVAPAALAKQISVERRGAPGSGEVLGDAVRLRQVLVNVLTNAVKFTEPGGSVSVTVARRGRSIAIEIADTGRGIAPEFLQHLFDPFSQTEAALGAWEGGLGLGLSISKQLVELHHGSIVAASDGLGRGATVTVVLPMTRARRKASPAHGTASAATLDRTRVLVIDDDHHVRDALALLLDRAGAVVDTADSAATARERIADLGPDALVCDIAMPVEDGYSFMRELRATGSDVAAIALTAYATEADASRALAAGFDRHLAKPIDFERLVANIDELVAARRAISRAP